MPFYEYRCHDCGRNVTLFFDSYAAYDVAEPVCTHCASPNLLEIIGRVTVARSEEARLDALADPGALGDLDENDPKSLGRLMRRMSKETGEDLGSEFEEVVSRLEAGEDPESIENSMPDLGADTGDWGGMDGF